MLFVVYLYAWWQLPMGLGKAKAKAKISQIFSKTREINILSGGSSRSDGRERPAAPNQTCSMVLPARPFDISAKHRARTLLALVVRGYSSLFVLA